MFLLTAAVILKAVLISFGRRRKRHHAFILERINFQSISDLWSATDSVVRVEEIGNASPSGGADAVISADIIIIIIIIVFSLITISV